LFVAVFVVVANCALVPSPTCIEVAEVISKEEGDKSL
jgi:hypothetical protein